MIVKSLHEFLPHVPRIAYVQDALPLVHEFLPENPIIVEAGAYTGSDTLLLAQTWPQGTVHAFEPVPEIYDSLVSRTKDIKACITWPYALSSQVGTQDLYVAHWAARNKTAPVSSLLPPGERTQFSSFKFDKKISVSTITLDKWALENNITQVDMLWLDMQGVELAVMQSSPGVLKKVRVIVTEIAAGEAYQGQPSCTEIYSWLVTQGFTPVAVHATREWFGDLVMVRTLNL